jgi:hypothetical protein
MKRICFLRIGLFKHEYSLILDLCMKSILFFTNVLIETLVQPNPCLLHKRTNRILFFTNGLIKTLLLPNPSFVNEMFLFFTNGLIET